MAEEIVYKLKITLAMDESEDREEIIAHIREKAAQMQNVSGEVEIWDMVPTTRDPVLNKANAVKEPL